MYIEIHTTNLCIVSLGFSCNIHTLWRFVLRSSILKIYACITLHPSRRVNNWITQLLNFNFSVNINLDKQILTHVLHTIDVHSKPKLRFKYSCYRNMHTDTWHKLKWRLCLFCLDLENWLHGMSCETFVHRLLITNIDHYREIVTMGREL